MSQLITDSIWVTYRDWDRQPLVCEWLVTLAAGLAGINCHCQWGLTGLLGGIVIMLAAGDASDISRHGTVHWCSVTSVGKSSGKGLEKRSKTHRKTSLDPIDPDVSGVFTALPVFFGWFCYQWYYDAWMKSAGSFKFFLLPWTPFDDCSHAMFLNIWQHLTTCNLIFKK